MTGEAIILVMTCYVGLHMAIAHFFGPLILVGVGVTEAMFLIEWMIFDMLEEPPRHYSMLYFFYTAIKPLFMVKR